MGAAYVCAPYSQQFADVFDSTTAYFPPLDWVVSAARYGTWRWEAHENYQKGGWRNRCRIQTANGPRLLSVPLVGGKHRRTPIREVRISHRTRWWRVHEQSIRSAYGRAPYFEYYADELFAVASRPYERLWDYNLAISHHIITALQLPVKLTVTEAFLGADAGAMKVEGVEPYPQPFTDRYGFTGRLSVLDGLFCLGPEVRTVGRVAS